LSLNALRYTQKVRHLDFSRTQKKGAGHREKISRATEHICTESQYFFPSAKIFKLPVSIGVLEFP